MPLDAAARVGLLTRLGAGMYRIHPALPAYLAAFWRGEDPAGYESQRAAATRALLSAYAALGDWLIREVASGDPGFAYTLIGLQQRTMGHLLGYALNGKHWGEALAIAEPMVGFWNARGQYVEADAWTDRVRLAIEDADGTPPDADSLAGHLWLFFTTAQAGRQVTSGRLGDAERTCREILAMLQAQPTSPMRQRRRAVIYHDLGVISQERGRMDEAADWFAQSLAIEEELGDRPGIARTYHQLGIVAELSGQLAKAADWYSRSLAITEELGDRPMMAGTYNQLGTVAHRQGRMDEAADWYKKSLAIKEQLGDRRRTAGTYHQLGVLAQERARLDPSSAHGV